MTRSSSLRARLQSTTFLAVLAGYVVLLLLNQGLNLLQRRSAHIQLVSQVREELQGGRLLIPSSGVLRLPSGTELRRRPSAIQETMRLERHGQESWLVSVSDGVQLRQNVTAVVQAQSRNDLLLLAVAGFSSLVTSTLLGPVLRDGIELPLDQLCDRLANADPQRAAQNDLVVEEQPKELQPIARSYNTMRERLVSSWRQQRTFIDGVAHELRTPLTLISGYAQRIERLLLISNSGDSNNVSSQLLATSRSILAEAERMARLVRDLLDLARLDGERLELRLEVMDAGDALMRTFERLDLLAEGRLRLHAPRADQNLLVLADPERLYQCLANLVENALRYSSSEFPVNLSAVQQGPQVVLHVSDQGPGVPIEERERIFQLFRRGSAASTASAGGSGIGLALVQALMEMMGGGVRVTDAPGGGADFQLWLPASAKVTSSLSK